MSPITKFLLAASMPLLALSASAQTGTAAFDFENGYVDITLTNTTLQSTGVQAGRGLYGITFDVGGLDLTGSSASFLSGLVVTCSPACAAGGAADAWDWASVSGLSNYFTALSGAVGERGPDLGILNSGVTSVGASLGGDSHNPLYSGSTTFRIFNSAITAGMQVSSYELRFGTTLAAAPPIPEPSTYALMMAGLGAVAFMARRRRQS